MIVSFTLDPLFSVSARSCSISSSGRRSVVCVRSIFRPSILKGRASVNLNPSEFQALADAFQFVLDPMPPGPEYNALFDSVQALLEKLDTQPGFRPSASELDNCIMALQFFCSNSPSASPVHRSLIQRFVSLRFRSF